MRFEQKLFKELTDIKSAIEGGDLEERVAALEQAIEDIEEQISTPQPLPVLEVTPFAEGEVTTEAELLAKFKLEGKAVTREQLFDLWGRNFVVKVDDYYLFYNSYIAKAPESLELLGGGANADEEVKEQVFIYVNIQNYGESKAVMIEL